MYRVHRFDAIWYFLLFGCERFDAVTNLSLLFSVVDVPLLVFIFWPFVKNVVVSAGSMTVGAPALLSLTREEARVRSDVGCWTGGHADVS